MDDKVNELTARVERLEARLTNLTELVESLAGESPSIGYWDGDADVMTEGW